MIVQLLDGDSLRQVHHAAEVVAMIVGEPHVVDLLHTRGGQDIQNPVQIALARVPGIHEERLP